MANKEHPGAGLEKDVVFRLLRGDDMEAISREMGFPSHELARRVEKYMTAGRGSLETPPGDPFDSEHPAVAQPTWSPWTQEATWLPE